jgi:hypothetical protein
VAFSSSNANPGKRLPFSAETRALRAVVRSGADLVDQRVAAANQFEAVLDAFWTGAKANRPVLATSMPA